jgi:hypothetical protein
MRNKGPTKLKDYYLWSSFVLVQASATSGTLLVRSEVSNLVNRVIYDIKPVVEVDNRYMPVAFKIALLNGPQKYKKSKKEITC